jgi:hypothetical protein
VASPPDFWLIECDTFWLRVPPAIACTIIAGPAEMMLHGGEQWLVRTDFPVFESDGTMTDRVIVDRHPADFRQVTTGPYPAPGRTPSRRPCRRTSGASRRTTGLAVTRLR